MNIDTNEWRALREDWADRHPVVAYVLVILGAMGMGAALGAAYGAQAIAAVVR